MKLLILLALNCIILSSSWPEKKVKNLTKMSIYYETLCGDSKRFIIQQLYPAYNTIKNHIKIELIPYGKAISKKIRGLWKFNCQHGPLECWGNIVQACVLAQNAEQDAHMEFINCFMRAAKRTSESSVKACSAKAGLSFSKIMECVDGGVGRQLLEIYGKITKKTLPHIKYVPTITFNDKYDADISDRASTDLLGSISDVLDRKKSTIHKRMLNNEDGKEIPRYYFDILSTRSLFYNPYSSNDNYKK